MKGEPRLPRDKEVHHLIICLNCLGMNLVLKASTNSFTLSNITSPCLLALFFIDSNQLADGFPLVKACPGARPPPGGCGVARAIPHVQRDVFVPVEIGSCGVQIRNDRSEV